MQGFRPGSQGKSKSTIHWNRRPWFLAVVADKFPRTKSSDPGSFLTLVCYDQLRPTTSQLNVTVIVIRSNQPLTFHINITAIQVTMLDVCTLYS
jgi:hypothetical protein